MRSAIVHLLGLIHLYCHLELQSGNIIVKQYQNQNERVFLKMTGNLFNTVGMLFCLK